MLGMSSSVPNGTRAGFNIGYITDLSFPPFPSGLQGPTRGKMSDGGLECDQFGVTECGTRKHLSEMVTFPSRPKRTHRDMATVAPESLTVQDYLTLDGLRSDGGY